MAKNDKTNDRPATSKPEKLHLPRQDRVSSTVDELIKSDRRVLDYIERSSDTSPKKTPRPTSGGKKIIEAKKQD